jgi:hypothetical protein
MLRWDSQENIKMRLGNKYAITVGERSSKTVVSIGGVNIEVR